MILTLKKIKKTFKISRSSIRARRLKNIINYAKNVYSEVKEHCFCKHLFILRNKIFICKRFNLII